MKRVEKLARAFTRKNDDYYHNDVDVEGLFIAVYRQALEDAAKLMTVHIDCPNCHAPGLTVDFGYLIRALAD